MAAAPSSAHPPFRWKSSRSRIPVSEIAENFGKEVDRDTLVKMVRSAANEKLANTDQTLDEVKERRGIADFAEAISDHETANALGATLQDIVVAATSQSH